MEGKKEERIEEKERERELINRNDCRLSLEGCFSVNDSNFFDDLLNTSWNLRISQVCREDIEIW